MLSILKFEKNALFPYFGLDSIGKTYYNLRSKGGKTYLQDTQGVQNMATNTADTEALSRIIDKYSNAVRAYLNKAEEYAQISALSTKFSVYAQSANFDRKSINFLTLGAAARRDAANVKDEMHKAAQKFIDAAKQMRDNRLPVVESIVSMAEGAIR